ncbi:hypothetical protein WA026_014384 [Henosepilachna vigintioctopunctata]|uniref:Uncharacterized protein n=1 Tax=Henosepilachna vigintioctopunctata TaxID=420089 RepID=A0AAW1UMN1_9CUCU
MEFVSIDSWSIYSDKEKYGYEKLFTEMKSKNTKKFNTQVQIQRSKNVDRNSNNTNEWIENLSGTEVPEYVNEIPKLGPEFAAPLKEGRKSLPIPDIITNVDSYIR